MISKEMAARYCREEICKIQNYEKAVNDKETMWDCHHRLGTVISRDKLIEIGAYYKRPAMELVFLTPSDHEKTHFKCKTQEQKEKLIYGFKDKQHTEESRKKISEAKKGRTVSEETRIKMSEAQSGVKNAFFNKQHTEKSRKKMSTSHTNGAVSKQTYQYNKNGVLVGVYPSVNEAARQNGYDESCISKCCRGKLKYYKGFLWTYQRLLL